MISGALRPIEEEPADRLWLFAEREFDETTLELRVQGVPIELELKPMEVLRVLLHRAEEVTSKEELLEAVWPGLTVVDGSLATAVYKLRKALGDEDSSIVRTVQRVGYRLGVPVRSAPTVRANTNLQVTFTEGMPVPGREQWRLVRALDAKTNGAVWLSQNPKTQELRVFKFANTDGRLRSLKREATVSRFLRQTLGERPELVRIAEWNFEKRPYYLESEFGGQSLTDWATSESGLARVTRQTRVQILATVAETVANAHGVGVIHSDLKPSNILIAPDGNGHWNVKVCDFGSALLLEPARLNRMGITNLGYTRTVDAASSITGTVIYMAPEVLAGNAPTAASDVYALGVILYQVIVGDLRRPLSPGWESQIDDPLLREDINEAACGDPSSRMSSAAALAERLRTLDLRRMERAKLEEVERHQRQVEHRRDRMRASRPWRFAAGISLLIAIMIAGLALHRTQSTSARGGAIAILQFENNGSDHTLDFLSFALPDEIETQLSYARSLPLRPFSLTSRYNPHGLDLHKVGNDLQISKIVVGSYFRTGDDLAITLEAFDVESNRLLWHRNLSVPAGDLRTMQGQIAGLARTELASALGATGNSNDSAAHPLSEGAYERYLHSLALAYDPAAVNKQGLELLEESVKEDPSYAPAWLELGRREYIEFRYGQGGVAAEKRWNFAVNRVLELDPGNLAASASLIVHQVESGQYSEALAHARELVRLRPDTSAAHFSLSYVLRYAGLMGESGKECDAAFAIDPYGLRSCAVAFLALGQYSRARDFINTDAGSEWANAMSIHQLIREGKNVEALQIAEPHIAGWESFNLLLGCARGDNTSEIADLAKRVKPSDDPETDYFSASHLAYCNQGTAAINMLKRAIERKYCSYPELDSDPFFDKVRTETDFLAARSEATECQRDFVEHLGLRNQ